MLCYSMTGEMHKPLVIGKAKNPRCFRNLKKEALPVTWKHNKEAWMTSELFRQWLQELNCKMHLQRCRSLLFLDNAPSHPHDSSMSHVKVVFFPANTTSKLQPLDQGVIQNFKVIYRKRLLRHVLAVFDSENTITSAEVAKSISVLDACQWISGAAKDVKAATVSNCFLHAGFPRCLLPDVPLVETLDSFPDKSLTT